MRLRSRASASLVLAAILAAGALGQTAATTAAKPDDAAAPATASATAPATAPNPAPNDPALAILAPLPRTGAVPPIVRAPAEPEAETLRHRQRAREFTRQIRLLRHHHFGSIRVPELRAEGIAKIATFTDPDAFRPLVEELAHEGDDVRLALLDHLAGQGDAGQAALALVAVTDEDDAIRSEATRRMVAPAPPAVLRVLDESLRSRVHRIADNAGVLAGALHALPTIPLLIFAQSTSDPRPSDEGDLAWIAIQTQRTYVANLQPVVGDNAAAYVPVMGILNEGIVLRVIDAVVVVYRTEIHRVLIAMTSDVTGESTASLGYDMKAWWQWYNTTYVPLHNERARLAALAAPPPPDESGGAP